MLAPRERDSEWLRDVDGRALRSDWVAPHLNLVTRDDRRQLRAKSDFPGLSGHVLPISERAAEAMRDLWTGAGELLPTEVTGARYWLLNVTRVIDALDRDISQVARLADGRVMSIEKYAFIGERLDGASIFKLVDEELGWIYFTEEAVSRIRDSGLVGFSSRELWQEGTEPWPSPLF